MQMKYGLNSPAKPPGLLRKLVALIVTVALVGVVLMFSAVLLVIIMIVGTIAWTYLWWKSRELRKRMRDFQSQAMEREQKAGDDGVFEGEVIRVVDSQNGR
jgi:O-antigen/teichoic acid export membrane protein